MKLGEKQELFARLLPFLLMKACILGLNIRVGDLFRDPRVHGAYGEKKGYSAKHSMHKLKLAVDLYIVKDGNLLDDVMDYQVLGEWWIQQHPLCRWGGSFAAKDGVHFSLTHDGRW